MASMKDEWKKTGNELAHALTGLGKMIVKTAKTGIEKADEWASSEDAPADKKKTSESQEQK